MCEVYSIFKLKRGWGSKFLIFASGVDVGQIEEDERE